MPFSQIKWSSLNDLEEPHYRSYNKICQDYSYPSDPFLNEYKFQAEKRKKVYQQSARRKHSTLESF